MNSVIPTKLDKCRGAMVLSAIGDALGWPNEARSGNSQKNTKGVDSFVAWKRRTGGRYYNHVEQIYAGEYSDDTQLVLSVARSLIVGNWEEFFKRNELPFWLEYERGGGEALLRAAKIYKKNGNIWQSDASGDYFRAGGNGAAMRILPHVIVCENADGGEALIKDIIKDAIITHGHPRALLGATCYAYALNYLFKKDSVLGYGELISAVIEGKELWGRFPDTILPPGWLEVADRQYSYYEEWMRTYEGMMRKLRLIEEALKKGLLVNDAEILTELHCFDKDNGAGDVSVLAALYLASRYANNPILGIKVPALLTNADTDTLASITGGLLGMLCGAEQIPMEWTLVQDYSCLIQITDILASESRFDAVKNFISKEKTKQVEWVSTPIGIMYMSEKKTIPCGKKTCMELSIWKTSFGQTIYRKKYRRTQAETAEPITRLNLINEAAFADAVKEYLSSGMEFALLKDCSFGDGRNRNRFDLLYFHRVLRCLVAVELKIGNMSEDEEGMQKILSELNREVKKENENPSMGIVVSLKQNNVQVKIISGRDTLPVISAQNEYLLLDKSAAEKRIGELLLVKN